MIRLMKDIDVYNNTVRYRYDISWVYDGNTIFTHCFDDTDKNHDKNIRILLNSAKSRNIKSFLELPKLYESINLPIPEWYYE